jgi:hypothetical protein
MTAAEIKRAIVGQMVVDADLSWDGGTKITLANGVVIDSCGEDCSITFPPGMFGMLHDEDMVLTTSFVGHLPQEPWTVEEILAREG